MIDINQLKKGDKFRIKSNDTIIEIVSISKENDEIKGFMLNTVNAAGVEGIVPSSVEYVKENIELFEPIEGTRIKVGIYLDIPLTAEETEELKEELKKHDMTIQDRIREVLTHSLIHDADIPKEGIKRIQISVI